MPERKLNSFMQSLGAWGWPARFGALTQDDLLVMDQDLLDAFTEIYGALDCATATPADAAGSAAKLGGQVIVLCRKGEWQLVKQLRRTFPGRTILSALYDLAPRGAGGEERPDRQFMKNAAIFDGPVIMLSVPYADAEYLAKMLAANKLAKPQELMDGTLAKWLALGGDFQITRYLDGVLRQRGTAKRLDLHLQSDVLTGLLAGRSGLRSRISRWFAKTDARIIYVNRRNKMVQAGVAAALAPRNERSLRHGGEGPFAPTGNVGDWAESRLHDLLRHELFLEEFLESSDVGFRMVTLEEAAQSPVEVIRMLGIFLDTRPPKNVKVPDFVTPYGKIPELRKVAAELRTIWTGWLDV